MSNLTSLLAPPHPHHITEILREGYGTRASGHTIKRAQVSTDVRVAGVVKRIKIPMLFFNQPCLIFTSLSFLVYFQTSLPSTLGFFVDLRSWNFQGLSGSCATLSDGSKTSACGLLVWADWSYGDSANNPRCAFTLTWPPLWHPLERYLRPRFLFGFKN